MATHVFLNLAECGNSDNVVQCGVVPQFEMRVKGSDDRLTFSGSGWQRFSFAVEYFVSGHRFPIAWHQFLLFVRAKNRGIVLEKLSNGQLTSWALDQMHITLSDGVWSHKTLVYRLDFGVDRDGVRYRKPPVDTKFVLDLCEEAQVQFLTDLTTCVEDTLRSSFLGVLLQLRQVQRVE